MASSSVLRFLGQELEFLEQVPSACLSVWTTSEGQALDVWLRRNKFSHVDFIEIFLGSGHLSSQRCVAPDCRLHLGVRVLWKEMGPGGSPGSRSLRSMERHHSEGRLVTLVGSQVCHAWIAS